MRRTRLGFTLLEVLLAIGIISMLTGSVFTFLWNMVDRRDTFSRYAGDEQAGTVLIERIERDVLAGLAGGSGLGTGIKGTDTSLTLLTRGVWLELPRSVAAGAKDQAGGTGGVQGDVQGSEYRFDARAGVLEARRWAEGTGGGNGDGGAFEVVSDHVQRLRFRYYNGRQWVERFDSVAQHGLPVAIEIAIWFGDIESEPETGMGGASGDVGGDAGGGVGGVGGDAFVMDGADSSFPELATAPTRRPDRLRVIVVPDGPSASWRQLP